MFSVFWVCFLNESLLFFRDPSKKWFFHVRRRLQSICHHLLYVSGVCAADDAIDDYASVLRLNWAKHLHFTPLSKYRGSRRRFFLELIRSPAIIWRSKSKRNCFQDPSAIRFESLSFGVWIETHSELSRLGTGTHRLTVREIWKESNWNYLIMHRCEAHGDRWTVDRATQNPDESRR